MRSLRITTKLACISQDKGCPFEMKHSDDDNEFDKYEPPSESAADKVLAAGRSLVPPIAEMFVPGSSLAITFFADFIKAPYDRRLQRWMEDVSATLISLLQSRGHSLDDLKTNDEFQTILIQASQAAFRTHQEEKITALRHAVVNTAGGIEISIDIKQLFIRYVDELTPSHLTLLRFLRENETELAQIDSYENLFQAFIRKNAESKIERDEFRLLCEDLKARVLLRISSDVDDFTDIYEPVLIASEGAPGTRPLLRVTEMGHQLLEFITSPAAT